MCNNNPAISIVIPVYNTGKYLEKCVISLLNQTFEDYEIILVDDGSTDNSSIICDGFSRNNEKVNVYHKSNVGLSHTRNFGTEKSSGEYITYVDSDDIVENDYLESLFSIAKKYNADVSSCEFCFCNEGENPVILKEAFKTGCLNGKDAMKCMLRGEIHGSSACGLLIKSELAKSIKFPIGKYHEDDFTTYKYYMNANTVAYTKSPLYVYYQHPGSIMHRGCSKIDTDELDAADHIYTICEQLGADYITAAMPKIVSNYCQVLFKYDNLNKTAPDTYERIKCFLKRNYHAIIKNPYISKKTKLKIILQRMGL